MYICPNPKCKKCTFKKIDDVDSNGFSFRCSTCGYETKKIIKNKNDDVIYIKDI